MLRRFGLPALRRSRDLAFFHVLGSLGVVVALAATLAITGGPVFAQSVTLEREEMVELTAEWDGPRDERGRPMVPDEVLERMENVTIEQAWGYLRGQGYHSQYVGGFEKLHPDEPIVGRALTARYMPTRPDLQDRMVEQGHGEGHQGGMNSWPIDALQQGDVYVADGYGKIEDGTLIGDNLGNAIYANSGNGVVFDGSSRDLEGLAEIDGFNAFVRGWHPSFIQNMMLTGLNTPIRIGEAHVLPGDVVLAKEEGVVFVPAHLAEDVVERAEVVMLRDRFGHRMLREGRFSPGAIDSEWTQEIDDAFAEWLESNRTDLPVPPSRVDELLQTRDW